MTLYALTDDTGAVIRWPYTQERFARDHPGEEALPDLADARDYGVVAVEESTQPDLAEGQTLDEGLPTASNGVYRRTWIVHDWLTIEPGGLYARIDGETVTYPYSAAEVRRDFGLSARGGALKQMDGEWGVVAVTATEPPEVTAEQVAEPDGIESHDGGWRQVWAVRSRTADELAAAKADKRDAIDARLDAVFQGGFTPAAGPLAGHALQTRNLTDRTNWLVSQAAYSAAVAGGQGAVEAAEFRTAANETITMSYADGLAALLAMAAWGAEAMANSWSLKDAVNAAETFAALDAIDIDTGWPA